MARNKDITSLEQLLERIGEADGEGDRVSLGAIVEAVGQRSFGPLLLLAGLVTLSPVGDIPGTPTIMAVLVLLIAGQLLFRRKHFWLPRWLLDRSVAQSKLRKAIGWLRKPARFTDRALRPRLTQLTRAGGIYAIAIVCAVIAFAMPVMEVVPFSATGAGAALTAFGLALIAEDGLLALIAFLFTALTLGVVVYTLL